MFGEKARATGSSKRLRRWALFLSSKEHSPRRGPEDNAPAKRLVGRAFLDQVAGTRRVPGSAGRAPGFSGPWPRTTARARRQRPRRHDVPAKATAADQHATIRAESRIQEVEPGFTVRNSRRQLAELDLPNTTGHDTAPRTGLGRARGTRGAEHEQGSSEHESPARRTKGNRTCVRAYGDSLSERAERLVDTGHTPGKNAPAAQVLHPCATISWSKAIPVAVDGRGREKRDSARGRSLRGNRFSSQRRRSASFRDCRRRRLVAHEAPGRAGAPRSAGAPRPGAGTISEGGDRPCAPRSKTGPEATSPPTTEHGSATGHLRSMKRRPRGITAETRIATHGRRFVALHISPTRLQGHDPSSRQRFTVGRPCQ